MDPHFDPQNRGAAAPEASKPGLCWLVVHRVPEARSTFCELGAGLLELRPRNTVTELEFDPRASRVPRECPAPGLPSQGLLPSPGHPPVRGPHLSFHMGRRFPSNHQQNTAGERAPGGQRPAPTLRHPRGSGRPAQPCVPWAPTAPHSPSAYRDSRPSSKC